MLVEVTLAPEPVHPRLVAPDDFCTFKVVVRGSGDSRLLADALASCGRLDPSNDHAWIRVDELRRLAGARAEVQAWRDQFDAMVEYAAGQGWLSPSGGELRAHVDWA
jgi:hypothetical protein